MQRHSKLPLNTTPDATHADGDALDTRCAQCVYLKLLLQAQ